MEQHLHLTQTQALQSLLAPSTVFILQPESKPFSTSLGSTGRWRRGFISGIFGARMALGPSTGGRKGSRSATSCSNQSLPRALLQQHLLQGTALILRQIHSFYLLPLHIFLVRDTDSRHKLQSRGDQLPLCLYTARVKINTGKTCFCFPTLFLKPNQPGCGMTGLFHYVVCRSHKMTKLQRVDSTQLTLGALHTTPTWLRVNTALEHWHVQGVQLPGGKTHSKPLCDLQVPPHFIWQMLTSHASCQHSPGQSGML